MITTQRAMWKFRCTLQWIKNLLGWMLLILFFMSIGWFLTYLLELQALGQLYPVGK
jgi:hypothetical protein